jgi:hypothetical protein
MKKTTLLLLQALITIGSLAQNVGIGTSTPSNKLEVIATNGATARFSGGNGMFITLAEGASNRGYIGSFLGNAEDIDFGTYSGNNTGSLHLATMGAPRLSVLPNGNVGIGTDAPEQLFSVAGGMLIDQNNLNNGNAATILRFGSGSGEGIGSKRNTGTNQYGLDFYTQSINRMTIANNGNIGINTITPNAKLEIRGALGFSSTSKRWEMSYDSTNGYFYIDEFGSGRRLFITNGGNVGIGTSTPSAKLDVNGDINIENKLLLNNTAGTNGQVLVSGGSGAAPGWRNAALSYPDRFFFKTSAGLTAPVFNDSVLYDPVSMPTSAISYSNGLFTINKAGFYAIEGSWIAYATLTSAAAENPLSIITLALKYPASSFNYLTIFYGGAPFVNLSGGNKIHAVTISYNQSIYFPAGTQFYFSGTVVCSQMISSIIGASSPLSIYLVAE